MKKYKAKLWSMFPPLLMLLSTTALNGQSLPERPAIERGVHAFERTADTSDHPEQLEFIQPMIPHFRTTADGRIGSMVKTEVESGNRYLNFFLFRPEENGVHWTQGNVGTADVLESNALNTSTNSILTGEFFDEIESYLGLPAGSLGVRQYTIIDRTEPFGTSSERNPQGSNNKDFYYIDVFACVDVDNNLPTEYAMFQITPIIIEVDRAKRSNARMLSVTVDTSRSKQFTVNPLPGHDMLEPMFTIDGKLLTLRTGENNFTWTDHEGVRGPVNQTYTGRADIVYAYSSNGTIFGADGVGGVDGFENLLPISYAPYDNRINGVDDPNVAYGFTQYPMRDPTGNTIEPGGVIEPGNDIQGTYPWIDHLGNNLFYTTIRSRLRSNGDSQYPNYAYDSVAGVDLDDTSSNTRGQAVIGLWTQGKLVQMDNLVNATDYGIGSPVLEHRMVELYQGGDPAGYIRIGGGRDNGANIRQPPGSDPNTTIFDSLENKLFFSERFKTFTPNDVVWAVSNGKGADEFSFDDYLNLDSFIVSHMTGALEFNGSPGGGTARMLYHDGFSNSSDPLDFNVANVRITNDGTALPARWSIPRWGTPIGSIRIEPVAMGGIKGKGLWLNGSSGIQYEIPQQANANMIPEANWFVGIFVDCRFNNNNSTRKLIEFPDGTQLVLRGRDEIRYRNASGGTLHTINLPGNLTLPREGWAHLAVQIFDGGQAIDFYHNGFLFDSYVTSNGIFQMTDGSNGDGNGTLTVGTGGNSGSNFIGWIDEFKVFAQTFDPEVCANMAHGTLVGVNNGDNSDLENQADLYGTAGEQFIDFILENSGQPTFDHYAVWYDYTDDWGGNLIDIPSTVVGIREHLLFPEAPLFGDSYRPESVNNPFCLSCHGPNNLSKKGLTLAALTLDAGTDAVDDFRRQPSQPPRRVFGNFPANWLGSTLPGGNNNNYGNARLIDEYVLDAINDITREVVSFSLIDVVTQLPVATLVSGMTVDYDQLVADGYITSGAAVTIRVNLDSAQGEVDLSTSGAGTVISVTDTVAPHSLFGYTLNGFDQPILNGGNLSNGVYTISATPRSDSGIIGNSLTVNNVTFQNMPPFSGTFQEEYFDNFESGFGNWIDGGGDCRRSSADSAFASSPAFCIRLRDDSNNSFMTTGNLTALNGKSEIRVEFSFITASMENGEDFWLQISTDGGSSFQTVANGTWVAGTSFSNGTRENVTVDISGYTLGNNTQLRIRCDASANDDRVYIDDVRILAR